MRKRTSKRRRGLICMGGRLVGARVGDWKYSSVCTVCNVLVLCFVNKKSLKKKKKCQPQTLRGIEVS